MFYVWFDDLNLWRRRVFGRAPDADAAAPLSGVAAVQRSSTR